MVESKLKLKLVSLVMMYKQGVVVKLGRFLGAVAVGGRYLGTSMVIILVEL